MSLEGAKFICLDEAGNHGKIVLAKGRKFTMGYYVSCDFVLVDKRAKGVHCEIACDAFGRVTIRNLSPDKPILVNGSYVEIKRILLNNSRLSILDKEYLWLFPKHSSNDFEDLAIESASTPEKQTVIPEQPPNSCPDFKLHRGMHKRFTVHNFAYCIQSDEEGNISAESNDENTNQDTGTVKIQTEIELRIETQKVITKISPKNTSQDMNLNKINENRRLNTTPEPDMEVAKSSTELLVTPKMNLINCTKDKENKSTQKKQLAVCHQSDVVITSFSPRETGVKIEKTFATIVKPRALTNRTLSTPKSVYSTPKRDTNENGEDDENEIDSITFYTPSTSKMEIGYTAGMPTESVKVLKNSSMHLIDLTTPNKLRPTSPYLKSALKASAKKKITQSIDKPCIKLPSKKLLGLSALPTTPVITDASSTPLETPSSVISVCSSTDISSVIDVTSDESNTGNTPGNVTGLGTPVKAQTRAGAYTPKRTPQSLMKRALLTSAKKQNAASQICNQKPTTPQRESINRIPLRNNSASVRTPVTPQASTDNLTISQLLRRRSISTPSRKREMPANGLFDNSPSTSNLVKASPSSSKKASRRSSLNPISAAKALPTSTPVSDSSNNNFALRTRGSCKMSPLHKVRKSIGGVPLSSHISKIRKSIVLQASTSKITSIKEKSPQQVISDRLVTRARKSLCITPISIRSSNMDAAAKTPSQTCGKNTFSSTKQSARKPELEAALFADKQPLDSNEADDLSRTFVIDSGEEEEAVPRDATFSPEKHSSEIEKLTKKLDINDAGNKQQTIEIPVDVEEVTDLTKEKAELVCENKNQISNEEEISLIEESNKEKQSILSQSETKVDDNKENNAPLPENDNIKTIVTEESFAEIINDSKEQNNMAATIETSDNPKESSQTESQESFIVAVEEVVVEENTKGLTKDLIETSNKYINDKTDVAETGFGEESILEISQASCSKNVRNERDETEEETLNKTEHFNRSAQKATYELNNQCDQQHIIEDKINTQIIEETDLKSEETKSLDAAEDKNKFELKGDKEKSYEYKPIVEDITVEGSLIEKEIRENEEINVSKQLIYEDITLEGSLIEDKVKSEEMIKEKNTEKVIKESTDKEPLTACSKISEIFEPTETLRQQNVEGEANMQQKNEMPSRTQKKVITLVDETENVEKSKSNQNELDSFRINLVDKNIESNTEISDATQQLQNVKFDPSVYEDAFDSNVKKTTKLSEITEDFKAAQSPTMEENVDDDLEDTNKLLEEIEDVLNKSDEIKQKHLIELEKINQESETPIIEKSESENHSQEKTEKVDETVSISSDNRNLDDTKESENPVQKLQENASNDEKVRNTSDPESIEEIIKLTKQEYKNENNSPNQKQEIEKSLGTITEISALSTAENFKIETPTIKTLIGNEENFKFKNQGFKSSDNIVSKLEKNTTEGNAESCIQEKSEAKEPINVVEIAKHEEEVEENIISQPECNTLNREMTVLSENDKKNAQTVENLKAFETGNIFLGKESTKIVTNVGTELKEQENIALNKNIFKNVPNRSESKTDNSQNKESTEEICSPKRCEKQIIEFDEPLTHAKVQCQTHDTKSCENIIPEIETVKECTEENIVSEIQKSKELNVIKQKTENALGFTPRRSTRRASQSTDTAQASTELSFTTRRSTRRASLSAELTSPTCTPTKRTTRRASLSVDNEASLTPKPITKRRTSISVDDGTPKPSTSKTQRAKTPCKQLEQCMIIPEEMGEVVSTVIMEDKEEATPENLQFQQKKLAIQTTGTKTPRKLLQQNIVTREGMHVVGVILEEEIEPEMESLTENKIENRASVEEASGKQSTYQIDLSENPTELAVVTTAADDTNSEEGQDNVGNIVETQDLTEIYTSPTEEKLEISLKDSEISTSNEKEDTAVETSENEVRTNSLVSEQEQVISEDIAVKCDVYSKEEQNSADDSIQAIAVADASNGAVGHAEQTIVVKDVINDNLLDITEDKMQKGFHKSSSKQHKVDKMPLEEDIRKLAKTAEYHGNIAEYETECHKAEELSKLSNSSEISKDDKVKDAEENLQIIAKSQKTPTEELLGTSGDVEQKESSTPVMNLIKVIDQSPKISLMVGTCELLKETKAAARTPRLGNVSDLVCTLADGLEEYEEENAVADLVKTPVTNISEITPSKLKKYVSIVNEASKTPLMTGMRELFKTPKREMNTPKLTGIHNLLRTPKSNFEKEEETEKLTPEGSKNLNTIEEMPSSSMKTYNLKGVKELLKTPKICSTPRFGGIRELMRSPKMSSTPIMSGVKELLKSPAVQEAQGLQTSSTHVKSIRESMKTPKMTELDKFLRTPTAKNIMIPSIPSSAVIEKSSESIEISTEYDLNVTNDDETRNLEELFETTVSSRFIERITGSYYGEEEAEHDETDKEFNENKNATLQETLRKSGEEAFDKLVGQETQIQTPVRKIYSRRSFTLQTPHSQSPFTAADVLSDLPKTDVEEWIETLGQAETPIILECGDGVIEDEVCQQGIVNESANEIGDISYLEYSFNEEVKQNNSFNESVIPETCAKVHLTCTEKKDPLSNTNTKFQEKETHHLATSLDAEISGINLLDQTIGSLQDEPSMLDEPLAVEEPSIFEEPLIVSDYESEAENTNNKDESNQLLEPLLLSDSEDLNLSQDTEIDDGIETNKNKLDVKQAEFENVETAHLGLNAQEKPMLENFPNLIDSLSADPLETKGKVVIEEADKTLIEVDVSQAKDEFKYEETSNDYEESISKNNLTQTLEEQKAFIETEIPVQSQEELGLVLDNSEIEIFENVEESSEIVEFFSPSKITEVLDISSTSQVGKTEKETVNYPESNLIFENIATEVDAAETHIENTDIKEVAIKQTKIISTIESEDIFVDTFVTEICEETNILNECKENTQSKTNMQKADHECEDIFMDNSNIDESFANEATNRENEAAVVEVTIKTVNKEDAQNVSLSAEADNYCDHDSEKQSVIGDNIIEFEGENIIIENVEPHKQEDQIDNLKLLEENTRKPELSETETNKSEKSESHHLKQFIGKRCELMELSSQDEKQPTETFVIELDSLEEDQVKTKLSKSTSIIELESLDGKQIEKNENKTSYTPKEDIIVTALSIESSTEKDDSKPSCSSVVEKESEGCIIQDSPEAITIFPDLPQSVIESVLNNEIITIAECELMENETTVLEADYISLRDSTDIKSCEALTEKFVKKPIDNSKQSSKDYITDNKVMIVNEKPSGTVSTKNYVSTEVKNSETNIAQKLEEPFTNVDQFTQAKTEIFGDKEYASLTKEENCNTLPLDISVKVEREVSNDFEYDSNIDKYIDKKKTISSSETIILEESSESSTGSTEIVKYDFEIKIADTTSCPKEIEMKLNNMKISNINAVKTGHRERIVSESNKEAEQGEQKCTTSGKYHGKIIKKPIEEKLKEVEEINDHQEILKDTITDVVKKYEKRIRSAFDSTQGSVKDDEYYTTVSRGVRRKIQKTPVEGTVIEEKKECLDVISQAKVREKQKAGTPKTLSEKTQVEKQSSIKQIRAESNKQISSTEEISDSEHMAPTGNETLHEVKEILAEKFIVEQNEETLTESHLQILVKEKRKKEELETQEHFISTKADVTDRGNKGETEERLAAILQQVTLGEEGSAEFEAEKRKTEYNAATNIEELSAETHKEIPPKEDLILYVTVDGKQNITKESLTKALTEDIHKVKTNEFSLKNQDETAASKETTMAVLKNQKKTDNSIENVEIIKISAEVEKMIGKSDAITLSEETFSSLSNQDRNKKQKRSRRKPTVSDSSQDSYHEDDNTRAKKSQSKVQKTSIEEFVVEKILHDDVVTAMEEIEEISIKIDQSVPTDSAGKQKVKVKSVTLEQTQKRGRRKATVSESSQCSIRDDEASRTRRDRRKIQKSSVEVIMMEEKTNDLVVSDKTDEIKQETEENQDVSPKFNDTEEIASDTVVIEDSKVESRSSAEHVKEISDQESIENNKHKQEFSEIAIEQEITKEHAIDGEFKDISTKRERKKRILQKTVVEKATTSRKGRRNVQVSIESKAEINSETKSSEDAKEDQAVQETDVACIVELHTSHGQKILKQEQQKVDTKQTANLGRHCRKVVMENLTGKADNEKDTTSANSEITTLHTEKLKSRHNDLTPREINATSNDEPQDKVQESIERTDDGVYGDKQSTKQTAKRGRPRKVEVEEVPHKNDTNSEDRGGAIILYTTRRGGRQKIAAPETETAALPTARSSKRNRKTPVQLSTTSHQQELAVVENENQMDIIEKTPTVAETTTTKVSIVRSRSKITKTLVEPLISSTEEQKSIDNEKQMKLVELVEKIAVEQPTTSNKQELTVANEEPLESLEKIVEIHGENEKSETAIIVALEESTDEDVTSKGEPNNDVIKRTKRTHTVSKSIQGSALSEKTTNKRARHQMGEVEEYHGEDDELIDTKKPQKSTRRRGVVIHEPHVNHNEESSKKSRTRRAGHVESGKHQSDNTIEPKNSTGDGLLSEVKITEVNLRPEEPLDQHATLQEENKKEVKVTKGRRKADFEENPPERHEIVPGAKTKYDHADSSLSIKRRVGRRRLVEEEHESQVDLVVHIEANETTRKHHNVGRKKQENDKEDHHSEIVKEKQMQNENTETINTGHNIPRNKENPDEPNIEKRNTEKDSKPAEGTEGARSRCSIGKKKSEQKDHHDKQIAESNKKDEKPTNFENSGDTTQERNGSNKKHDHDDHNVCSEKQQPQAETKKGRSRTKKNQQEEYEQPQTHSPDAKHRIHRRKESHTDSHDHSTKNSENQSDEKIIKDSEAEINISSTNTVHQTPQRIGPVAKRGRKVIEHITAESQELEDTPGRRARNVPQRRAATAYHNYDETSDSEVSTKTKKKTDSPRKSLEPVKKSPTVTATITSAPIINPSPSTIGLTITARGRTRKPTAKVQQFLEEERAKADTPKKRALLAAAAGIATSTPQHTPARRGRKASTIEVEAEGTLQASKVRGRGRPPVSHAKEAPSVVSETATVVEEKKDELQTTPPLVNLTKVRKGGRKAKTTDEERNKSDEPPAKKSPLELESEKQDSSFAVETPTAPTRVAGRRNAAAAAKARIEEDALAAAAIEPPKRARAKKAPSKMSTPVGHVAAATDTDAHISEVEEEQKIKGEKIVKNKNSPQTREHRLASGSINEDGENLDDIEISTIDKSAIKKGRKAVSAISTDSPAVKRGRKAKTVEEVTDKETPTVSKTSRGRGRGRKNVNFDEHHKAEATSSQTNDIESANVETSEPAKKATRTRRK